MLIYWKWGKHFFLSYLSEKKFFTETESCPALLRAKTLRKVRNSTWELRKNKISQLKNPSMSQKKKNLQGKKRPQWTDYLRKLCSIEDNSKEIKVLYRLLIFKALFVSCGWRDKKNFCREISLSACTCV